MSKTLKFVILTLIFVAVLGGTYTYFKTQQVTVSSIYKAVPINAAIIININQPDDVIKTIAYKNHFWKEFSALKQNYNLSEHCKQIDSIFQHKLINNELLQNRKLLISFHELGKNQFKPIFFIKQNNNIEAKQLCSDIETFFNTQGKTSTSKYDRTKTHCFIPKNKNIGRIYYGAYKGVVMLSQSELLLQDAIRQIDAENGLFNNSQFIKIVETSGQNADANIFLQYKHFNRIAGKIINFNHLKKLGLTNYSEWGLLDLNMKQNTMLLNGFSSSSKNNSFIQNVFKGQKPQSIEFTKYINNIPEAFSIIGISDIKLFRKNIAKYMESLNQKERFATNEKYLNEAFGNNSITKFEEVIDNELTSVIQRDGSHITAIKTTGHRDAEDMIEEFLKFFCKTHNEKVKHYKKNYKIDKGSEFTIYKMPLQKVPARLLGVWFSQCTANYMVIFEDYMVFADSYKSIKNFIYSNVLQKTFAYNGNYQKFATYVSNKSNFFQFINLTGTGAFNKQLLTTKANKYFNTNKEAIRNFYGIGFQFSVEKEYLYNSLIFRYQPVSAMQATTQWESRLDTTTHFKPALVRNHYTDEKEIFVQDEQNNIYLIGNNGRIIWKHKFDKPIISSVEQVDFYKNGKLQMLFNTENKLYLLDRNGNPVERFPITLPAKATSGMSVFDYDNRKNYRIFVPCDTKIYVFDLDGKIVTGFNFEGADNTISKPVQHFRHKDKDYIVVTDENRTYILNRKGEDRIKLKEQFTPSANNNYTLSATANKMKLITTDSKGNIKYINTNGKVETKTIQECSETHYFKCYDIDNNGTNEYFFIDKNKLSAYNNKGEKLFSYKFDYPIHLAPSFYRFSAKKHGLGITDSKSGKIYLFNAKGKLFEGFPLNGRTQFSIATVLANKSYFNLLVGGNDFYLYKYKLK